MTWADLLKLLQSYHKEDPDVLQSKVSMTSTDTLEYLDLVESTSKGTLTFIADWNYTPEEAEDG